MLLTYYMSNITYNCVFVIVMFNTFSFITGVWVTRGKTCTSTNVILILLVSVIVILIL